MYDKTWLYSGIIVVILALMGVGIWLVLTPDNPIEIPDGDPVLQMDITYAADGERSQFSVYDDGTAVYVMDSGLDIPIETDDEYTRTWRTGTISQGDIDYVFSYLASVDFNGLEAAYVSEEIDAETVSADIGDYITIMADNGQIDNKVAAFGYSADPSGDLPYPLNFIYDEFAEIIENNTEEALVEQITN